jgi:uncharacterized protein YkwD
MLPTTTTNQPNNALAQTWSDREALFCLWTKHHQEPDALGMIPETHSRKGMSLRTVLPQCLNRRAQHPPAYSSSYYYNSNHVLINQSRIDKNIPILERSKLLDDLAQLHAHKMAGKLSLFHSRNSILKLQLLLGSTYVGENILRGESVLKIHQDVMRGNDYHRINIEGRQFKEFGMATARARGGTLYLCQLFRG